MKRFLLSCALCSSQPSPLLRLTKKPYTGVVPLPAENALRVWYQNLDVLEPGTKKFSEELWEKNEVKEEESEASVSVLLHLILSAICLGLCDSVVVIRFH